MINLDYAQDCMIYSDHGKRTKIIAEEAVYQNMGLSDECL